MTGMMVWWEGLPTDHGLHDEGATPEDSDLLEAGVPVLLDVV